MFELAPLILDLAVILGVASLVTLLFQKIRQPVVLGYLIAGMIIGPYTPPHTLLKDIPNIQSLSELGVIFLMFSLGLEFSFHKLKRVGFSASVTGLVEVFFMLALGLITGLAIGWSFNDSLFLAAALAISSTTIIIKALEDLRLKHKRFAELVFGVLVVEDLLAILLLVGLSTLVLTHQLFSLTMGWAVIKLILVVGGWFLVGYFLVPSVFRYIMPYVGEETLTVISVALCLFLVCLAVYFHYSPALGAFIMGSILAETSLVHRIEQLMQPLRYIFAAIFFVSVGMLIDPRLIWQHFPLVLLLAGVTIVGKLITTSIGSFLTGQSMNTSLRVGFSMAQIGEFSFIIIGLGIALNAISASLYPIIVAVSAITTFTTPYFIRFSGYLGERLDTCLSERVRDFVGSYAAWVYRAQTQSQKQPAYRQAVVRLLVNAIIIAIIFSLTEYLILPEVSKFFIRLSLSQALSWFIAVILSSPFIFGMLDSFRKLTPHNSIPFYLSLFIFLVEIIMLSVAYFHTWLVAGLLVLAAILFFKLLYKKLEKSYHWFENRLVKNLQKNAIQQEHSEKNEQVEREEKDVLANFVLKAILLEDAHPAIGQSIRESKIREQIYGLIVGLERQGKRILDPAATTILQKGDLILMVGERESLKNIE